MTKILNRNAVKIIAVTAMTMDHLAPTLFAQGSVMFTLFRIIGRLTFPILIYMLADGFRYTHDLKGYIKRMFLFSVISWFTFSFLETGSFLTVRLVSGKVTDYMFSHVYIASAGKTLLFCNFSIITNLLLALLALTVWVKTSWHKAVKILLTVLMLYISLWCDWKMLPITLSLTFYYLKDKKAAKWAVYAAISAAYVFNLFMPSNMFDISTCFNIKFRLYRVGMVLLPVLIELFYNGKAGSKSKFSKWFFYAYYPAHQVIIGLINLLI